MTIQVKFVRYPTSPPPPSTQTPPPVNGNEARFNNRETKEEIGSYNTCRGCQEKERITDQLKQNMTKKELEIGNRSLQAGEDRKNDKERIKL